MVMKYDCEAVFVANFLLISIKFPDLKWRRVRRYKYEICRVEITELN